MALCRTAGVIAIFAVISVITIAQGGGGDRGGKGKPKGKPKGAPAWGTRGGGKPQGPPSQTIKACEGLAVRAQCSFLTPRNATKTGICINVGPKKRHFLHCRPSGPKGGGPPPAQGRKPPPPQGGRPPPPQGGKKGGQGGRPPPNRAQQRQRLNSSIAGCVGKKVEDDCSFRPPVSGDQEARGFAPNEGPLRGGQKQRGWQHRKGDFQKRRSPPTAARQERPGICVPVTRPNGDVMNFCRMLPPPEALVPCAELDVDDKCAFTTNGTQTYVGLKVSTGMQAMAETKGKVLASFLIHGEWTDPELFFTGATQGEEKTKTFLLPGWPKLVSLTIWSNDAWCFWKISVNGSVILKDPKGAAGSDAYYKDDATSTYSDSRFWIEGPPSSQIFDVPAKVSTGRRLASTSVNLRIFTATGEHAATKGSVFVRFLVQDKWTKPELMFTGATKGEEKLKTFMVAVWPEKVFVSTNSSDAYSYWKIMLNEQDVVEDPSGSAGAQGYDPMDASLELGQTTTQFWIASPLSSQSFPIPGHLAPRGSRKHRVQGTCQQAWWDMLNGTLHCRPGNSLPAPKGRAQPNSVTPDFDMKSGAEAVTIGTQPTEEEAVELKMVVKNVDYAMLMSDVRLARTFTSSIQKQIAKDAGQGVYEKDVKVTLTSGSVVVTAQINPAAFVSRSYLRNKLQLASTSLSQNVAQVVTKIPGIVRVSTGTISVSPAKLSAATPAQADVEHHGGKSLPLAIIAATSGVIAICMCFVSFCLWRKLRKKGANPTAVEINGTTVAVGRPVEADMQANSNWQSISGGTPVQPVAPKETFDGKPN